MLNLPSMQEAKPQPRSFKRRNFQSVSETNFNNVHSLNSTLKDKIEYRDYNIITQQNIHTKAKSNLPKLGYKKDFPYPRNNYNYEKNIDFTQKQNQYQQQSNQNLNTENRHKSNNLQKTQTSNLSQSFRNTNINLFNSSSLKYNFINNTQRILDDRNIKDLRGENQRIGYKTANLTKIVDKGRLCAPNYQEAFQTAYKDNNNTFKRNQGFCTDVYNRAHGYGPGTKPFRKLK
ncbi:hypothetical protein PPERSA_02541 [Pseudocohnilembus persalinus]|uniref:Uncharacterized protein n=1 Tax=Pseudocohnilembus persalinus TaxID=266149 RepID=A0A0V0R623_PSEPJ|nr:hypothetical protein PPERSA_02541 [Pseudocohnilembus persalinus]|eukprot:KRX09669.1 hypothetical protein PPERSA_02541 [Pseudocohnilembus persalinus]